MIVLGSSGSGKTVFLSSMFHELSTQGGRGFYIKPGDKDEQLLLTNAYEELILGDAWPDGTKLDEFKEWKFTCFVQKKDLNIFPACQFIFIDYAGGRLTDNGLDSDRFLQDYIVKADTLLCLIDGKKLFEAMEGDNRSWNRLTLKDLEPIIQAIQETGKKPVHFLITKWDLFSDSYELLDVRKKLLSYEPFKNVIEGRSESFPIRLIPISAVGDNFANFQDGIMLKTGASPKPFQVEMPLACVVPDMMEGQLREIAEKRKREEQRSVTVEANLNWWDRTLKSVGGSLKYLTFINAFLPENYQFSESLWNSLGETIASDANQKLQNAEERSAELKRKRDESITQINNESSALESTIKSFIDIREILEYNFPHSDLRS